MQPLRRQPLRRQPLPEAPRRADAWAEQACRFPRLLAPAEHTRLLDAFRELLPIGAGTEPHLAAVMADAVEHPGSLVRAQLVYALAAGGGVGETLALRAAIAVEYFHTASLIFDDLPAMDDATERRGRTCPHLAFGEASAMLGALALINQGYALLWQVLLTLPPTARDRAAALITETFGADGLLNGQALDLHFAPRRDAQPNPGGEVLEVAAGKTVPLIRLTLLLPALLSGERAPVRDALARLASLWGLAYQVIDDFKDCLMTESETGKTPERDGLHGRPNLPTRAGRRQALKTLDRLLAQARRILARLALAPAQRAPLGLLQSTLDGERAAIEQRLRPATPWATASDSGGARGRVPIAVPRP